MWINMDQIPGSVKMNRNRVLCRNVIQMGKTTKIRELFSTLAAAKGFEAADFGESVLSFTGQKTTPVLTL